MWYTPEIAKSPFNLSGRKYERNRISSGIMKQRGRMVLNFKEGECHDKKCGLPNINIIRVLYHTVQ